MSVYKQCKLKDLNYSQSLGVTAHHPRGQIALKYGNPIGSSKLLNIEWNALYRRIMKFGIKTKI